MNEEIWKRTEQSAIEEKNSLVENYKSKIEELEVRIIIIIIIIKNIP